MIKILITTLFFKFFNLLIFRERGKGRERVGERHRFVVPLTHLLADSCMCPDWDRTRHLGISGWCSNQLISPTRASHNMNYCYYAHLTDEKHSNMFFLPLKRDLSLCYSGFWFVFPLIKYLCRINAIIHMRIVTLIPKTTSWLVMYFMI